jgi:hypothetical protein
VPPAPKPYPGGPGPKGTATASGHRSQSPRRPANRAPAPKGPGNQGPKPKTLSSEADANSGRSAAARNQQIGQNVQKGAGAVNRGTKGWLSGRRISLAEFVLGFGTWAVILSAIRYGAAGIPWWFRAKWLNDTTPPAGVAPSSANTQSTADAGQPGSTHLGAGGTGGAAPKVSPPAKPAASVKVPA